MRRTIFVLLAGDNPEEVLLTRRAFRCCGTPTIVDVVTDGQEMMDYLQGKARFANRSIFPLPGLILLDIKDEEAGIFEVLEWLNSRFQAIPVAILSSVEVPKTVKKAYALGAIAYLGKPVEIRALERLLQAVHSARTPRRALVAAPLASRP